MAEVRQENIDYFNNHKDEIISAAASALSEKKYQLVMNQTSKYLPANNSEINKIYTQAKNMFEKLQREAKTKEIVAKLKMIPVSEFKENKDLYQQLVELNPDNTTYQQKFDFYSQKLTESLEKEKSEQEKRKKEREVRLKKFGAPPTQSTWDGSYYAVKQYLKRVANDPSSIKMDSCTEVYHTESGWLVGCNYRGKNAFGGMIRQSNWFTIVHDQVIQMHDASDYRP